MILDLPGFTTAKAAATKMGQRTQIRKKRNPVEETGMVWIQVNQIGHFKTNRLPQARQQL